MAVTFTKVISSSPRALVVLGSDGQTYSVTGDRSQRNNNPGAIAYSPVAIAHGAIGYDTINIGGKPSTRIAVFPDMASGQAAQQELLFGSDANHPAYRDMTLQQAISRYAPGGVDGNPPPQSYFTRIANSIGVSPDTKLSDLTPAQQAQFMQVQAGIEGSRPQRVADAQGNVVQMGSAGATPPAGDWASAFANLPSQPANSALSAINANTVPLPPARPQDIPPPLPIPRPIIGANAGDSLAFNPGPLSGTASLNANNANYPAMDAGYDPVTGQIRQYANPLGNFPARPAVIATNGSVPSTYAPGQVGQVPSQSPSASLPSTFPSRPSVVGGNGLSTGTSSMAMNDLPKPISVAGGATALPAGGGMGSGVASLAPQPLPASARPAPPTNAKGYVIGQTYTDKSGYQYEANADGSFTKVANPYRAPTAIQTLFEAAKPGVMGTAGTLVNDAKNFGPSTVNAAQGLGSSVASAASGVGSLLGNLFHPPASVAPTSYDPPLAYSSSGSGSSGSSYHAPPVSQTPSSAYNPVPLAPLPSTFPSRPSYPSPNNVPATIQQRYLNPAYVAPSSGISATGSAYGGIGEGGFASGSINMSGAPMLKSAAQAAAPQYLYRTVANPAWSPSPVTPAYLTPAQLAALRAGANPYANWKGPVGDVMNFLHGQPGGGLLGLLGGNNPQHNGLAGLFGGGSSGGGSPAARTGTGLGGAGYTPVSNGSGGYTNTAGDQTYVPSAGGYIATGGSGDRYSGDPGFQASDGSWY